MGLRGLASAVLSISCDQYQWINTKIILFDFLVESHFLDVKYEIRCRNQRENQIRLFLCLFIDIDSKISTKQLKPDPLIS